MTLVIKVNCRACNGKCGDYKHLLDEIVIDDESTTLAALLRHCTTLECFGENHESGMPEHICNSCVELLTQSYLFKKMVLKSNRSYMECLQKKAVEKQVKEEINTVIEEVQIVEQEIGSATGEENVENMEEFVSESEEIIESNNGKTDYEYEGWLQNKKDAAGRRDVDSTSPIYVESEDDNSSEILVKNEAGEESGKYIINILSDNDEGEELKGFDSSKQFEEKNDNFETKMLEDNTTENEAIMPVKGKAMETNSLLGEKLYVGKIFGKTTQTKSNLNIHMRNHSDEKRHKCSTCGKCYRTVTGLRLHGIHKHSNIRPYVCGLCNKTFQTSSSLQLHERKHRNNNRYFACKLCDKTYQTLTGLREHRYVHTGEKPHVCEICGKKSRQKNAYYAHMRRHSDEKRYNCSVCGQLYRTYNGLRVHERLHRKIRPYSCEFCDKTFNSSEQRKRHILLHTGERPFICGTCGNSFRDSHSYKRHMIIHDDVKPYQCEVCGNGFTQKCSYKRHMLVHTNLSTN